jgi:hypothetical protein
VDKGLAKARTRDSMQEVAKLIHLVHGRPRIISDPPLLVPIAELLPALAERAAAHVPLGDPAAVARLLAGLRKAGAEKQAAALAERRAPGRWHRGRRGGARTRLARA